MDFIELLVRELNLDRRLAKAAGSILFIGSFAMILILMVIKASVGQPIFNGYVLCVGFFLLLIQATIVYMMMGPEGDIAYVTIEKFHKFLWGWITVMADAVLAVSLLPFGFNLFIAVMLGIFGWYSSAEILRRVFNWNYFRLTNIAVLMALLAFGILDHFGFINLGGVRHGELGAFFMKTVSGLIVLLGLIVAIYGTARAISCKGATILILGAAIVFVGGVIYTNWGDIGIKSTWDERKAKAEAAEKAEIAAKAEAAAKAEIDKIAAEAKAKKAAAAPAAKKLLPTKEGKNLTSQERTAAELVNSQWPIVKLYPSVEVMPGNGNEPVKTGIPYNFGDAIRFTQEGPEGTFYWEGTLGKTKISRRVQTLYAPAGTGFNGHIWLLPDENASRPIRVSITVLSKAS